MRRFLLCLSVSFISATIQAAEYKVGERVVVVKKDAEIKQGSEVVSKAFPGVMLVVERVQPNSLRVTYNGAGSIITLSRAIGNVFCRGGVVAHLVEQARGRIENEIDPSFRSILPRRGAQQRIRGRG